MQVECLLGQSFWRRTANIRCLGWPIPQMELDTVCVRRLPAAIGMRQVQSRKVQMGTLRPPQRDTANQTRTRKGWWEKLNAALAKSVAQCCLTLSSELADDTSKFIMERWRTTAMPFISITPTCQMVPYSIGNYLIQSPHIFGSN